MSYPIEVRFHGVDHSDKAEQAIHERAEQLQKFYNRIVYCEVVVQKPHRSQQHGNIFDIHIKLGVPGPDIVISQEAKQGNGHEDPFIVMRDAFKAAERRLKKLSGKQKNHRAPKPAEVMAAMEESADPEATAL